MKPVKQNKDIQEWPRHWDDVKEEIQSRIQEIIRDNERFQNGPYIICDGYFNQPIQKLLDGKIYYYGPTVPMVALVEKKTGFMHFINLKILFPKCDL